MPAAVLRNARATLEALETQQAARRAQIDLFAAPPPVADATPSPVEEALRRLDPDMLSPKEALQALYDLRSLLGSSTSP
jgi:DNA mismatch repair protein MutS